MAYSVPAVQSAIAILRYLRDHQNERCSLSNITRGLQLNRSTCHAILKTLEAGALVTYDESTSSYGLGGALIALGAAATRHADYLSVTMAFVRSLVNEIKLTCLVGQLLPDGGIMVIDKADSLRRLKLTAWVGERFPVNTGSLGKCYLTWLPRHEAAALLERTGLRPYTPNSITDVDAFWREIERARVLGYTESHAEYYTFVNGVTSPVFGPDGRIVLVLCVMGHTHEFSDDLIPILGEKLRATSVAITEAVSGTFPPDFPRSSAIKPAMT